MVPVPQFCFKSDFYWNLSASSGIILVKSQEYLEGISDVQPIVQHVLMFNIAQPLYQLLFLLAAQLLLLCKCFDVDLLEIANAVAFLCKSSSSSVT